MPGKGKTAPAGTRGEKRRREKSPKFGKAARGGGVAQRGVGARGPQLRASTSGTRGVAAQGPAPVNVQAILAGLAQAYPDAQCALVHHSAWELLVATILSAQCTDARVNVVTPALFAEFPTPAAMAKITPAELEPCIRSTGFYHNKAKSIVGAARRIVEAYGGRVPGSMPALLTLPGVARKTANVVLGVWFHQASGIVVDTHVRRVSQRLELTRQEAPEKIERDLQALIPRKDWIAFSHRVIAHGRVLCLARKPKCVRCPLAELCHAPDKTV